MRKCKCKDCGAVFDEAVPTKEKMGEFWGAPAYEDRWVCPECGSDEFYDATECKTCGEWFIDERAEEHCPKCMEEFSKELSKVKDHFGITIDDLQDWIAELFEW